MTASAFLSPDEIRFSRDYLEKGAVVTPVADRAGLDRIRDRVAELAAAHLGLAAPADPHRFLDTIHQHVDSSALNTLRLHVIQGINAEPWLRPTYFRLARPVIEAVAGNELCMQRRINLSVQLPDDDSSVLATHADVWSGDSAFEVVVWLPLVDVYRSKSMFLLPPADSARIDPQMARFPSVEALYREIEPFLTWIDIPYGSVLLFNQNLMHGNRINREMESRWTMNCRFKSVMSPYADKKLGEFFEPITLRAATRAGMHYSLPRGFDE